jgi:hypothetical protein
MDITSLPQVNCVGRELKSFRRGSRILSEQLSRQRGPTRPPNGLKNNPCCQELLTDPFANRGKGRWDSARFHPRTPTHRLEAYAVPKGQPDSSQTRSVAVWTFRDGLSRDALLTSRQAVPTCYPGTSCLATISPSLREKSHSPIEAPQNYLSAYGCTPPGFPDRALISRTWQEETSKSQPVVAYITFI